MNYPPGYPPSYQTGYYPQVTQPAYTQPYVPVAQPYTYASYPGYPATGAPVYPTTPMATATYTTYVPQQPVYTQPTPTVSNVSYTLPPPKPTCPLYR